MVDRAMFSAAAAAARRREGVSRPPPPRDGTTETAALLDHLASMRLARESRETRRGARDDAAHGSKATTETGWASGGAAGAR